VNFNLGYNIYILILELFESFKRLQVIVDRN